MPFPFPLRQKLLQLPRSSASWLAGVTQTKSDHVALVLQGDGVPRLTAVVPGIPSDGEWQQLWQYAFQGHQGLKPMRPATVRVLDQETAAALRPLLEPLKVKVEVCESLPVLQTVLAQERGEAGA